MICKPMYLDYLDGKRSARDAQIMYDRDKMIYEQTEMMKRAQTEHSNTSSTPITYASQYLSSKLHIIAEFENLADKYDKTSDEFTQYLKLEGKFRKLIYKLDFNNEKIIWLVFLQFILIASFLFTLVSDIPKWLTIFTISNIITALSIAHTVMTNKRITLRLPEIETEQQILLDKAEQLKKDKQKAKRQANYDKRHNIHRETTVLKLNREV